MCDHWPVNKMRKVRRNKKRKEILNSEGESDVASTCSDDDGGEGMTNLFSYCTVKVNI